MKRQKSTRAFTLSNPTFLAIKAGAATALALIASSVFGNPDLVSATFIAVLCCSPTVSMGLRNGLSQYTGSVLGGALGVACLLLGAPLTVGIPVAVSLAVLAAFHSGFPQSHTSAAFTALFVQAVPFGEPLQTLGVRLGAVALAVSSGVLVDVLVSSMGYEGIFRKRLARFEQLFDTLLARAVEEGPTALTPAFGWFAELDAHLHVALDELRWRRAHRTAAALDDLHERLQRLGRCLHLIYDLELIRVQQDSPVDTLLPFLSWVAAPRGDAPTLPAPFDTTRARLIDALRAHATPATDDASNAPLEDAPSAP